MKPAVRYYGPPEHRAQLEAAAHKLDATQVVVTSWGWDPWLPKQQQPQYFWLAYIHDGRGRTHMLSTEKLHIFLTVEGQVDELVRQLGAWSPDDPLDNTLSLDD